MPKNGFCFARLFLLFAYIQKFIKFQIDILLFTKDFPRHNLDGAVPIVGLPKIIPFKIDQKQLLLAGLLSYRK